MHLNIKRPETLLYREISNLTKIGLYAFARFGYEHASKKKKFQLRSHHPSLGEALRTCTNVALFSSVPLIFETSLGFLGNHLRFQIIGALEKLSLSCSWHAVGLEDEAANE